MDDPSVNRDLGNVGFEPGYVGGRTPQYSKLKYQRMLTQQMYGQEQHEAWVHEPKLATIMNTVYLLGFGGLLALCAFGGILTLVWDGSFHFSGLIILLGAMVFVGWLVWITVVSQWMKTAKYIEWRKTPEGQRWYADRVAKNTDPWMIPRQ
jgi:hypothetical protein